MGWKSRLFEARLVRKGKSRYGGRLGPAMQEIVEWKGVDGALRDGRNGNDGKVRMGSELQVSYGRAYSIQESCSGNIDGVRMLMRGR